MLCQFHYLNDLNTCCFRGAKFIGDKHLRETMMQYNLRNPGSPPAPKDGNQKKPPPSQSSTINSTAMPFEDTVQELEKQEEEESTV